VRAVHGHAGLQNAGVQDRLVDGDPVHPTERREEGGMDVDHRHRSEPLEEPVAEDAVEAGKDDQVDVLRRQTRGHEELCGLATAVRGGRECGGRDPRGRGAFERGGMFAARTDVHDPRIEPAIGAGVDERLEIRAPAGDQNADPGGHAQRTRGAPGRAGSATPRRIALGSARSAARSSAAATIATSPIPMFQVS
jgi:hypothetical protein